jgi:hypothetical protein
MDINKILKMDLTEFWKAQTAIRIHSDVLGEDVYFASRAHMARMLDKECAVWLPKELAFALELSDKDLIAINKLKRKFHGFITKVVRSDEEESEDAGSGGTRCTVQGHTGSGHPGGRREVLQVR